MRDYFIGVTIIATIVGALTFELSRMFDRIEWQRHCRHVATAEECERAYEAQNP